MANYARQQSFDAYKQPVLHKFGVLRAAKEGGAKSKCRCGFWAFAANPGAMFGAEDSHLKEQKALYFEQLRKSQGW
jgi:hypothetical protein